MATGAFGINPAVSATSPMTEGFGPEMGRHGIIRCIVNSYLSAT